MRHARLSSCILLATLASCGGGSGAGAPPDAAVPDASTAPAGPLDHGVLSRVAGLKDEFETHLAQAPDGTLGVTWIAEPADGSDFPAGYSFSSDGGRTWLPPASVASPSGGAHDPVLVADARGHFVLVFLGADADGSGIFAARATGGKFDTPTRVSDPAAPADYDKPWAIRLADGTLLVTYQGRAADGTVLAVAARSDDGSAWTYAPIADDGAFRNLFFPCRSASAARVWVTFYSAGAVALRYSDDGGATWSSDDTIV
jgi:hypothetical protein